LKVPPRPRHLGSRNTERGAVVQRAKRLVELRPQSGYGRDELVAMIEDVG